MIKEFEGKLLGMVDKDVPNQEKQKTQSRAVFDLPLIGFSVHLTIELSTRIKSVYQSFLYPMFFSLLGSNVKLQIDATKP